MRHWKVFKIMFAGVIVVAIAIAVWQRDRLGFDGATLIADSGPSAAAQPPAGLAETPSVLEISPQARKNLSLVSRPARTESYWRSILIPGQIADRPGVSDRGVTSPAVGVVTVIHAFPGDTIRPGEPLFTLRLFSEYLQNTQSELFKARRESELVEQQIDRLSQGTRSGAVPESRLIEQQNQLARQNVLIQAYRQDLLTRGLTPAQIQQVEQGSFVSTIEISAPPASMTDPADVPSTGQVGAAQVIQQVTAIDGDTPPDPIAYEVQDLAVELGQQVQAGQLLGQLSNHQSLYVIGHAFKSEAAYLEAAAQQRRPIQIEFAEDNAQQWPDQPQTFEIRHLSNAIDPSSRTFDFFIPLENQSRGYQRDGEWFLVWRYRPGQRARLHVPVQRYDDVFVLPAAAVVREGPEAYVFRQNGDLFKRLPVHVLHEDRQHVVIANDGSIAPGTFLAQSAAASLNRVLKAQSASGQQPGVHVHPDGTVHAAH